MATQKVSEVLGSYAFVIYFCHRYYRDASYLRSCQKPAYLDLGATNLIIKIILNVILIELGLRGIHWQL